MQLEDESFLSSNHSNPMRQAGEENGKLSREGRYDERVIIYNHVRMCVCVDIKYLTSDINMLH